MISLRARHDEHRLFPASTDLQLESVAFDTWAITDEDIVGFLRIASSSAAQPVLLHCQFGSDRTGVMIASGFGAVITLMLSLAPDNTLRGMIFWLMGDLENTQLFLPALLVLAAAMLWCVRAAPSLNVLLHGDASAQLLGIQVVPLRAAALFVASLATASAVAVAGSIGFVGLVVPHGLRLWIGNDQRLLLPASALAGGGALALADLLARTIVAPLQLPVGVITAMVGVPVLLSLLARGRK